jgi:cytochrome c oxidase subunit I+III
VHVTRATPDQVIILPRATKLPLVTASVLACAVLGMLFQVYWLALLFAACVCGLFVYAAQTAGQPVDHGPLDIGRGLAVPPHTEVHGPPPWYALIFAIVADAAIFTSLLYAAFYNWLVADGWPPPALADLGVALPLATAAALLVGPAAARAALGANAAAGAPMAWIAVQALGALAALAGFVALIATAIPDPRAHAYAAVSFVVLGYGALHAFIALLFLTSNALRLAAGYIGPRRSLDLRLTRLWQDFAAALGLVALAVVLILPILAPISEARP